MVTTSPAHNPRGGALDALRFAAAAFIVLYHFGFDAPRELMPIWDGFGRGWLATNFFLMLSGYVLTRAYGAQLTERRVRGSEFFIRRLLRVWPAHLIVLAGFAVVLFATSAMGIEPRHPQNYTLPEFVIQALLIEAWGLTHVLGWNAPTWSLSALVVCYGLFPAFWTTVRRMPPIAALAAAPLVLALSAAGVRAWLGESIYDLRFDAGLFRGIPLFLVGVLLARGSTGLELRPRAAAAYGLAAAGAVLAAQIAPRNDLTAFATVIAIGTIIVAADASRGAPSKLAAWLGRMSFPLYISHALGAIVWFGAERLVTARLGLNEPAQWALWALAFPFVLGVAWVFERTVDAPVQRWIKAVRKRPEPRPAPAPSV